MNNALRQIEIEDIIFEEQATYNGEGSDRTRFLKLYENLESDGVLAGKYTDTVWIGYSGVKHFGIDFGYDQIGYDNHFRAETGIPQSKMDDMLRCYALYNSGGFILPTIQERIMAVKEFVVRVGDPSYWISDNTGEVIREFLFFINIGVDQANLLLKKVHYKKTAKGKQRKLSPMINYLAIANEIKEMYEQDLDDERFVKWFPVWFWSNITFVIPLRATETMLTPFDCIEVTDDGTYITLRRSKLKKQNRTVYYNVDRDYVLCRYKIPDNKVPEMIRKYCRITGGQKRKYLFVHSNNATNWLFSLQSFNALLAIFIRDYLIGNRKYDFVRSAYGIKDFEIVTAGDARPIAMANLYYSDVGGDICRQIADHVNINTSAGYYTNVSETVYASSIIRLQNIINKQKEMTDIYEAGYKHDLERVTASGCEIRHYPYKGCSSPKQPYQTGNISDCIAEDHLYECLGCRYYTPTHEDLEEALTIREKDLDEASRKVVDYMANNKKIRLNGADFDRIFLGAHTGINRYKTACDAAAKEEYKKWQRHKDIQTTN